MLLICILQRNRVRLESQSVAELAEFSSLAHIIGGVAQHIV